MASRLQEKEVHAHLPEEQLWKNKQNGEILQMMFRLKKLWVIDGIQHNLWNDILSGTKTEEFRDATPYWWKRLFNQDYYSGWSLLTRAIAKKRHENFKIL